MNNKERDEKFLKSWLKKKISITTSTVVGFLITGAVGGGAAYGAGNRAGTGGNNNSVAWGQGSSVDNDSVAVGANARAVSASGGVPAVTSKGVAIGNNAKAEGSVSVGELSSSNHFGVAIGYNAGAQNTTTGASFANVTIGANTRVGVQGGTQAAQGIAIGSGIQAHEGAWAKGDQSIAIGANTESTGDSSIAIGGDDLKSVSNKTSSYSDARFDKNGNKIGGNSNNTASVNNIFSRLTGRGAILNGGIGTDGTNYSQWRNTQSGQGGVALGVKSISGDIALAIGTFSEATGTNSVAIGTGAQTPQSGAVAIGGGSTTNGLQGRQITDADITLTDGTTMTLTNFAGASGVLEGSMVSFGKAGNERQLKHIAPGEVTATSTDGINGSQLFAVAKKLGDDISKFKYVSIKSNDAGNKLNDGATANNAIAIGPNASTKVESAVSLGDGANVLPGPTKDKAGTLLQTVISSGSGVAIGKNATATQAGVAIGDTSSTVTSGIAIGREAKVTNKYEAASGPYVVGDSQDGYLNYDRVQNPDNLKYSNTENTGNDIFSPDRYNGQGIAIGYKAESNMFGTSLGNSAVAKQGGLALGTFAKAEGATATAIGLGANSSGARAISMGRQASATTDDSVAIGTGARGGATSAGGSVAVGGGAAATGTQAIAIGGLYGNDLYSSSATKDGAGNLTKNTQASGEASIAMGVNTKATGKQALAMGSDAQAKEEASIAMGVNAVSENGIAIGKDSISGKDASVSVGLGANSNAGGIAVGKNAKSKSATSIGIGEGAIANANSVVIGTNTNSGTGTKAVLIGDGSSVGTPTKFGNATGVISIGQNAGKDSAGPNLMSTINLGSNTKVGDAARTTVLSQSIAIGSGNSPGQGAWARGDQSISIGSDTESTGDSSIAIGGDDLVNVSRANSSYSEAKFDKNGNPIGGSSTQTATINNIFSKLTGRGAILAGGTGTDGRTYDKYSGTKSGQGAVALGVKAQSGDIALAIGTMAEATGTNSVAIGTGAQAPQSNAVAIGGGSTTFGIQGRQVKDADVTLADGTTMNYGGFAGADNVLEGSMVSFGRQGKERQLKHIAPGEISATSTDGINGSQLYSVAKKLGEGWKADAGGNKIGSSTLTSVKPGNTVVYSAGSNLQVKQTIDATNGKQTYEYSLNKDLTGLDSVTTKTITIPGATPGTNDVVIGKDGISAGNKVIKDVAPGVNGTDAVNKNQLDQKIGDNTIKLGGDKGTTGTQNLSQAGGLQFNIKGGDGLETSASGTDVTVQLDTVTKQKLNKAVLPLKFSGDDYDPFDETSTVVSKELGNKLEIVGGADTTDPTKLSNNNIGTMVDGTGKINIKLAKELKDLTSAEFKTPAGNKTVINGDGLTVTPVAPGAAPISVTKDGISAGDKKVTNVAPGTISATSKDAINGSQFHGLAKNTIQLGGDKGTTTDTQTLDKTGGIKFDIVGANGITTEAKDGKVTVSVDPSKLSAGNSKLSYTANGDTTKQEVKLSDGLNFTDGNLTTASVAANGVVKYDVKTTTLTSTDGKVTVPTTDGVATAKDVANAINNSGWKANAGGNVDGASTSTLVKAGDEVVFKAGDNLTVKQDLTAGKQEYTYKLNKDLTGLDSVTSKTITVPGAPGTNDVVIGKDGISAGNKVIKDVAPGVNGTDAVNKNQLDQKIGDNTIKLGGDTGTTATQNLSKAGGLQFNVVGANGIETSAAGTDVTVKLDAATRGKIDNAADKNLSNLTPAGKDVIKDTAAWKVKANSNAAETVKGGDEVVFKDGAGVTITQNGKEFTIAADTSKISKDTKISYTANGAAPKKEVSLADGFNFENGNLTTASVDTAGKVKYDVKTSALTSTPDGKVTVPTTDGVATAKDVANAINNSGWKANAGGNVDGTPASTLVKSGDEVVFKAGDNLTVKQDLSAGKQEYTYKLNKDLTGLDSVTSKTITVPGAPGTNDVVIGKDGISAGNKVIKDVAPGVNGTDAVNKNQLDTATNNLINKGMNFSADDYDPATANTTVSKKLGERLEIVGGADKTKLSDNNIGSVVDNTGKINVKLAKELKDLTSAEFKTPAGDKTVINGDGLTVSPATPGTAPISVTKDGISAGDKVVKNVAPGTISKTSTDAINGSQLYNLASNTIQLGGDKGTTDKQQLDNAGGIKFDIVGANGITTEAKDGKVTVKVDSSTIGSNSKLKYTANAGTKEEVTLADGLNFTDGNLTTASVAANGVVKYDVKTTTLTSTDGKVNTPAANNLVTANDVANAINNAGWKANAGGNVDGASTSTLVKAGDEVVFKAGDNLTVKQDLTAGKQEYTYKLNKDLTGLDSVTTKTITIPGATPGTNDVVIGKDGISAGNKVIKDVAPGVNGTDAVNKNQLDTATNNLINKGMNFSADDYDPATANTTVSKKLGERLEIVGGADKTKLSDNNIGSVVDNTGKINVKLAKELKDLTSAEFKTPAGDKTVINGDGLTVSPATPGTAPISITKDGISAGDKVVKNVAPGAISKTSTDAINGSQLYNLSSNTIQLGGDKATTTDKQTLDKNGGIKFDIVGANGITTEAKDGKVTVSVDTSTIGANTKLKYKSNSDAATAQEVKLSDGLDFKNGNFTTATVGANGEVKYDTVTQTLSVSPDGKAGLPNPATPGATTPNGLVTAQDVANALNNVGWNATADATGTGIKTGTPSAQLVKNGSTVSYVAGDNLTVAQDVTAGDHKYTYSLNKELKDLTSAEFKTAAGDKTVINGDGLTVSPATPGTAPISITKDGISAGDKKVTNVAPGTISSTSTDAINGSQFHKLATNTIQLGGDNSTVTATQQLDKTGGIKFDIVGANGITTEAKDGKVTVKVDSSTIGANAKLSYTANGAAPKQEVTLANGLDFKNGNFTTATVGANGEVKYDTVTQGLTVTDGKAGLPNPATPGATTPNGLVTAQDVADALNNVGWKATVDATGTGAKTGTPSAQLVKNGSTVSYVAGDNLTVAQDVTAGDHKYTYSLNKVLKDLTSAEFKTAAGDKTVINGDGLTVSPATPGTAPISVTKDGISAGDKVVKNVAPGTISSTSTDAINGSQFHKLATNTIQLGGDNATTTATQQLDKAGGIKFNIVGENGITTKATGDKVTIGVDTSTIGANIKLKYKSNSDAATAQEVKLSDGLDFKNGNFTTATVGANGEVKYDTVTQTLSVSPDGKAGLPNPATPGATTPNGLVTAQDVANALNSVGWNATADATGTGVKTGTPSAQLVKNGSTVSYVAGDNLTVAQDVTAGDHKYTYSLNKQLKDLTSAEFVNPTSGNKTVVNGDGLTITPSTPGAKNISITKDGISAGDKKITDVADGDITPTSKDAINGSQLYKLASNTISLGGDNSTVTATQQLNKNGGIKFNIVGDNGIITEANNDKVTVKVNAATIGSNITLKYAANGANGQTVKLSDGLNFQDGNFTKASVDAQGKVKYDTVTQAIAPTADGTAQVAPGSTPGLATSADVVNAINNSGWKATAGGNVTGTPTSTVVKNGQEVEFNAGDNLKVKQTIDPTTGKQTYEYSLNKDLTGLNSAEFTNAAGDKTKITAGNTEYTNAAGDKTVVNAGGLTISSSTPGAKDISVTKDGISAGDKVIKNVAAGVNDTDAVNVSQLKDVDNKITNVNNTINKGLNFKGNTGATVNKQLGDTLEIVGEGTKADSEYSGQNLKVVEDGGKLVVKMDKNLKSDTVTADAVNTNSVTVGASGKDGVITVKDANGKDGVSINGKDGSIGLNGKDGSSATISTVQGNPGVNGTPGTTMDRIQYTDNSGTPHQVATLDDGMKYGGDTGAVINKKLNQQVNVVGGITDVTKLAANDNIGVVSDGSNNLKVRLAKDLDGLESVKVRDTAGNSTVVKGDGVTITSSSGDTVSLTDKGLDNGGNVITNVAAGKDGTDAVNVDQLNQTVSNVVNAAGDAIAHVNNKVDKLGDRVNKGLAGAAAMAGLEFMDIGINQATVAAAVGGYRGTHAVAVGVQAAPTENTRINAKVSMTPGSRTETMYSVGASYRFNWR